MKCKQASRLLSSYTDGELAGRAQVAVTEHLAACPACRRSLAEMREDRQLLAGVQVPELSPFIATRVMAEVRSLGPAHRRGLAGLGRVVSSLAAAVLVVAGLGAGALIGTRLAEPAAAESGAAEQFVAGTDEDPLLEFSTAGAWGR